MHKPSKTHVFIALFFVSATLISGCGSKPEGKVLARAGDVTITDREFEDKVKSLPRQLRAVALNNKKQFLEDMAAEHFLLREAEKRKVAEEGDVKDLLNAAHRKIVIAKLIETEVDKKIALEPDEAQAYYDAHKEEFMTPVLLRASHILVKTEEEAKVIKAQLDADADFEQLARQKSIDSTAIRGGDLGFFQKGQFIPEFDEIAFKMKKGETSGPEKSRFGYHIMRVNDYMEPMMRDFKSVQAALEERLLSEKRSAAFKAYIKRLKGNVEIKIDEQALASLETPASPPSLEKPK